MEQKRVQAATLYKSAGLEAQAVTEDEMRAINKYTIEPLTADDVFVFSAVLCDSAVDRQFEYFSPKALHDMEKLFLGRTVIKDHVPSADNQIARIYHTEVVDTGEKMENGEPYMQLKAKCYMVKTTSNADLITEIKAGIKKEGSVGFAASSAICNICKADNVRAYCRHWPGKSYDGTVCTFKLDSVSDAYEFSLVSTPAQRAAGATKSYTGEVVSEKDFPEEEPAEQTPPEQPEPPVDVEASMLRLRARIAAIEAIYHRNNND